MNFYYNERDYIDYILDEIKVGNSNSDLSIKERQTNFYKRLYSYNIRTLEIGRIYGSAVSRPITYNQSTKLLNDTLFFKYFLDKKKLSYVPVSDICFRNDKEKKYQSKIRIKQNTGAYQNENDDVSYNTMINTDIKASVNDSYDKNFGQKNQDEAGEFGVIRSNWSKDRGRPSNTFRRIENDDTIEKSLKKPINKYQPLKYDHDNIRNRMGQINQPIQQHNYYIPHDNYKNMKDSTYQRPYENTYNNIPDKQRYYQDTLANRQENSYHCRENNDPKIEFRKCHDSWNRLYKSMTNAVNYNDSNQCSYDISTNNNGDEEFCYPSNTFQNYQQEPVCVHCDAKETSLWRRLDGKTVCNACGLYYKMHGVKRPISLKKTIIKKRKRISKKNAGRE